MLGLRPKFCRTNKFLTGKRTLESTGNGCINLSYILEAKIEFWQSIMEKWEENRALLSFISSFPKDPVTP